MDIKDKYVLHIGGHVENNTSYYEEHNSNYSINTDLILEESKYVREMGYEIKVNKLYDDYPIFLLPSIAFNKVNSSA